MCAGLSGGVQTVKDPHLVGHENELSVNLLNVLKSSRFQTCFGGAKKAVGSRTWGFAIFGANVTIFGLSPHIILDKAKEQREKM